MLLTDLFSNIQATQARAVGSLFREGFPQASINNAYQVWQLPAVHLMGN